MMRSDGQTPWILLLPTRIASRPVEVSPNFRSKANSSRSTSRHGAAAVRMAPVPSLQAGHGIHEAERDLFMPHTRECGKPFVHLFLFSKQRLKSTLFRRNRSGENKRGSWHRYERSVRTPLGAFSHFPATLRESGGHHQGDMYHVPILNHCGLTSGSLSRGRRFPTSTRKKRAWKMLSSAVTLGESDLFRLFLLRDFSARKTCLHVGFSL